VGGALAGLLLAALIFGDALSAPIEESAYEGIFRETDDPLLRVELIPRANRYVNADGFFGRDYDLDKPAGVWRVVGLGDSVAMYYAAEEMNHLSLLERSLPPLVGRPVEVLNLAVASYETPQQVRSLVVKGLKYAPDFVLVSHCINDGIDFVGLAGALSGAEGIPNRPSDDAIATHALIHDVMARDESLDSGGVFTRFIEPSHRWQSSLDAFESLSELASRHGFGVVVVLFPALFDLDRYDYTAAHASLTTHLEGLGLGVVDLLSDFRVEARRQGGPEALRTSESDAIHPSPIAYRRATEAIRRWLAEHEPWAAEERAP
jgi:hypothetical protein